MRSKWNVHLYTQMPPLKLSKFSTHSISPSSTRVPPVSATRFPRICLPLFLSFVGDLVGYASWLGSMFSLSDSPSSPDLYISKGGLLPLPSSLVLDGDDIGVTRFGPFPDFCVFITIFLVAADLPLSLDF